MPLPQKRRTATKSEDTPREPRGTRRKRETRTRLLDAALKLMAKKGMEGVAINEITEAADVGFGSFYNYFDSKETIHAELVKHVFVGFSDQLDALADDLDDPAEVIAVAIRHTLLRARREPTWGQFLMREGLSARLFDRSERLMRDVQRGIASKRFTITDPLMNTLAVGGMILTATATLSLATESQSASVTLGKGRFNLDELPERAAAVALGILGLTSKEAEKVVRRSLPPIASTSP